MWRHGLVLLLALVGCDGPDRRVPVDALHDAPVDAAIDESRMPFMTSGTTPAGSLDGVRFISVGYLNGFCPPGYYVNLYISNRAFEEPVVRFHVPIAEDEAQPPTGTIAASARLSSGPSTDQVSFEIVHVDMPPAEPLRIAGRMMAASGSWNIDFFVDAQTPSAGLCI